jgi:hypothetical protein
MPRPKLPPLELKLRVRLTERMTKQEALRRLKRTLQSGTVQPGIDVYWIDWRTRREGRVRARGGEYANQQAWSALRDFYRALTAGGTEARIAVVE